MITLIRDVVALELPQDLFWDDELTWTSVAQATERSAFVDPGFGKLRIDADSLIASLDGLIVFAQVTERSAFVGPGIGILWIYADSLIVSVDGLIIFA